MNQLSPELSAEIRAVAMHLPPYEGGGVSYQDATTAYVATVTLLHDSSMQTDPETGLYVPRPETEALLVRRRRPDGTVSRHGAVSGYVDTMSDPDGVMPDSDFDPLRYTARNELIEECSLPPATINEIDFTLGQRLVQPMRNGGTLHLLPMVGVHTGTARPAVNPDGHELVSHLWAPLDSIGSLPEVSPHFLNNVLVSALGGLGLADTTIRDLLRLPH